MANIQRSMTSLEDRLASVSACQMVTLQNEALAENSSGDDAVDQATRSSRAAAGLSQLTAMHDALRRIAREVITDCDNMVRTISSTESSSEDCSIAPDVTGLKFQSGLFSNR